MGKLAQATNKYMIIIKFEAEGTVEKPDVIGAVFGQTEGLLGPDMDLRELQKTGRIGRIDVDISTKMGKSSGAITIPSSLDSSETALIAACMETIERVGPCNAKIVIEKIDDVRNSKRKYIIERAKELLSKIFEEGLPEAQELSEQIKEAVRSAEISSYKGLPAGPNIEALDSLIIVEGRADVINLLRCGIKNVIAMEGSSVPQALIDISKQKLMTAFLDGDRGGDLNLKELIAVVELDSVARAPFGKEVEELSKKEVFKALREKIPIDQAKAELTVPEGAEQVRQISFTPRRFEERKPFGESRPAEKNGFDLTNKAKAEPSLSRTSQSAHGTGTKDGSAQFSEKYSAHEGSNIDKKKLKEVLDSLTGTRAACLLDDKGEVLGKVPVREMFNAIKEIQAHSVVFDGEIDQKLVNFSSYRGVKVLVGTKIKGRLETNSSIQAFALGDFQKIT